MAISGSLHSWESFGGGAIAHKAFSGPIGLLPEVEHVWSCFPALAMTCKPPVHKEQEEAQTLLFLWQAMGYGGNQKALLS